MSDRSQAPAAWVAPLTAILVAPAAYLARFGYGFGFSDQDEFLPWLLRRMEPSLLGSDWFVGVQQSGFNVRSGFVWLLEQASGPYGIEVAVAAVYGLAWIVLTLGVYRYLLHSTESRAVALVATVVALALVPRWTLGGNAMPSTMLVPSMVAWALAVTALVLHRGRRYVVAGLVIGVAAWMQVLVAFQVAVVLVVGAAARAGTLRSSSGERGSVWATMAFGLPAALVAFPFVALVFLGVASAPSPAPGPDLLSLLVDFRAPHHYAPAAFPPADYAQFLSLALLGLLGLAVHRTGRPSADVRYTAGLLAASAIAMLAGWVSVEYVRFAPVALIQPFKVSVIAALVLLAGAASGACEVLDRLRPRWLHRLDTAVSRPWIPILGLMSLLAALAFAPRNGPSEDTALLANWATANTGTSDILATPPSVTGLRWLGRRAVVVNYKAVPHGSADGPAWYRRLRDLAPGAPARVAGRTGPADLLATLDRSYEELGVDNLTRLADRYRIAWLARRTRLPQLASDAGWPGDAEPVRVGPWFVYHMVREPVGGP